MRLARIHSPAGPLPVVADGDDWVVVDDLFAASPSPTGERRPQRTTRLAAPVEPRVVLGMAHNSGPDDRGLPPQAFMKSARTVVGPDAPIVIDPRRGRVNGEVELVLVIGRPCRNVSAADAPSFILGWTAGNDVTAIDQIEPDEKMIQSKSGDGFTPIGPWIETDLDPLDAALAASLDGQPRVTGTTADLAWNPYEVVEYLSSHLTLGPGDIVLTGAPGTAFAIRPGDSCSCTVSSVGPLENPVVAADPSA